jgi:hypothetical protein
VSGRLAHVATPWLALLVVVLTIAGARTAQACDCSRPPDVAFVSGPYVDGETGLELRSASAAVRCEGRRTAPRCEYEALYLVHNPSAQPLRTAAVVLGSSGTRPRVWLDHGPVASREPDALDERAMHHANATMERDELREPPPLVRSGFVIEVPAQASVELRVATPITPTPSTCGCEVIQIERWHPLVSRRLEREQTVEHLRGFGFQASEGLSLEQRTEVPLRWTMDPWLAPHPRRLHGGRWEGRRVSTATDGRYPWNFAARPPVLWGGPFAAVGVGWRDGPRIALRAGWEVARPSWLVTSLAVESDAHSLVAVVPAVEATFPYWPWRLMLLPAPAVGVGAPIQVWPDLRAAVRTQLRLGWYAFSILGAVDVYPPQQGWAGDLRGALLFQIGL